MLAVTDQRNRAGDIELGISGSGREQWSELAQRLAVATTASRISARSRALGLIRAKSELILREYRSAAPLLPRQDSTRASSSHGSAVVA